MKLKNGIVLTKSGNDYIMVTADEASTVFSGMIKMNGTAACITELLMTDRDEDQLVLRLIERFDIDDDTARRSIRRVVDEYRKIGLMES